jgi:integrase
VSLKDARLARDAARLRVKGDRSTPGVDIVQEKRAAREDAKAAEIKVIRPTFEQCAETFIREHWLTWSKKHRNQWPSSLKRYAYPTIGKLTIPEIKPSHIYEVLRPIWLEKRETANRVRGRIETIIAKNVYVDDTDFRNPAELTKQLREKLPRDDRDRGELIFPNPDGGTFSENAMLAARDRLGSSHVTVHGFRSTFATWAEECTGYPDGAREAALAHKYKSETTAAYQRGQKLEKRRALMKDWAQFLSGSNVIGFREVG